MSLQQFKDEFVLLLEAGFIAINQADEDSARALFHAAHLLNPKSSMPDIGYGYIHFHKLELKEAVMRFEKVIQKDPSNEMARTFLGMCLSFTPNLGVDGEKLLHEVVEKANSSDVRNAAKATLEFVEKHIKKKSGSPMDIVPRKHHNK